MRRGGVGSGSGRRWGVGGGRDTEVMGADAAGMDSLFVLGGVHCWSDLAVVEPAARPRYVATDLRSLHSVYVDAERHETDGSRWTCGEASAWVSAAGELTLGPGGAIN